MTEKQRIEFLKEKLAMYDNNLKEHFEKMLAQKALEILSILKDGENAVCAILTETNAMADVVDEMLKFNTINAIRHVDFNILSMGERKIILHISGKNATITFKIFKIFEPKDRSVIQYFIDTTTF